MFSSAKGVTGPDEVGTICLNIQKNDAEPGAALTEEGSRQEPIEGLKVFVSFTPDASDPLNQLAVVGLSIGGERGLNVIATTATGDDLEQAVGLGVVGIVRWLHRNHALVRDLLGSME
jgi:hypothetical protein